MEANRRNETRDTPPQQGSHLLTILTPATRTDTPWTQVVGRKERRREGKQEEGGLRQGRA